MNPKTNRKSNLNHSNRFDRCQTPHYALDPLVPYLQRDWVLWECAQGEGQLTNRLESLGFQVIGTDILTHHNFFYWQPDSWACIVTNPPYSIKYQWLKRCYELHKPFALLIPLETMGAAVGIRLFESYGMEAIIMYPRVNFKMPNKGYSGKGAQFPTA